MKNLLFYFLFAFSTSIVSAQEVTVAYITEPKTNAEWLESSTMQNNAPIKLTENDKLVVRKIANRLVVGKALSISGLVLTPVYLTGSVLTTFQGAFTRMPAHYKLSKFIINKYRDTVLMDANYTDFNLDHLLSAERHLDKAQTVSYIALGLSVLNVIGTSILVGSTNDVWGQGGYILLGVVTFNLTNIIATSVNMGHLTRAIRELRQVH